MRELELLETSFSDLEGHEKADSVLESTEQAADGVGESVEDETRFSFTFAF